MKSITEALAQHLAGDVMTTCRLWKIKRKATTEVSPVQAYLSGPSYSDPSCGQAQIGSDWEFVTGEWRTVSTLVAPSETGWLYAYGFGFNVPSTATIIGVLCQVNYSADSATANSSIEEVSLFNSGAAVGTEKTPNLQFTASQQTMSQARGQTDLWGYALTPAIVNSSNFGFGIRAFYDGVRLYASQFAMTVYYTLPASTSSSGSLSMVSSLTKHTNFAGNVEADTSADAVSGQGAMVVIDGSDNSFYMYSPVGGGLVLEKHVRKFDVITGDLIGEIGQTSGLSGQGASRPTGGLYILNHPLYGKWLVICDGASWNNAFQLMALEASDAAGTPIAPGTVTNAINNVFSGFVGGQTGCIDTDPAGNIWAFGTPAASSAPHMYQYGLSGSSGTPTLSLVAGTDFNALLGWTYGSGTKYDPKSGTLVVWGKDSGGAGIVARVDQNNAFAVLVSSSDGTVNGADIPQNIGPDGCYVSRTGLNSLAKIDVSNLSVVYSSSLVGSPWNITASLNSIWYDAIHNYAWAGFSGSGSVAVLDLNNPGTSVTLSDPNATAETGSATKINGGYGFQCVSADGNYGVTNLGSNSPVYAFIDFWGQALQSAGIPLLLNSVVMGFTDHDLDILYDDGDGPVLYIARTGATWSAIESKADMAVDNLDIDSFLESDAITEGDIRGGLYDGAECTIYLVNWADLTQKHLTLRYGVFGKVKIVNGLFTTEIRGLAYALNFMIGDYFGPLCRAELFSTPQNAPGRQWYCNLNAALFQQNGSVASSADAYHIVPAAGLIAKGGNGGGGAAPATWFDFGFLMFTSGSNQNLKYEVESWDGTTLTLEFPLAYPAAPGDTFMIEPGCDKTLMGPNGCVLKFNNAVNHRGEPWIPGLDAVLDMFPA